MKKILIVLAVLCSMFLLVSCIGYEESSDMDSEEHDSEGDMDTEDSMVSEEEVSEVMDDISEEGEMVADVEIVEEVEGDEYVATIVPGMPEAEEVVVSSGDITLYGPEGGFSVSEYNVAVGQAVSFVNMNDGNNRDLDMTLTFQNVENSREIMLSDLILYGESYSHTFTEAGQWRVWTVEYGGDLVITVS